MGGSFILYEQQLDIKEDDTIEVLVMVAMVVKGLLKNWHAIAKSQIIQKEKKDRSQIPYQCIQGMYCENSQRSRYTVTICRQKLA